MSRVNEPIIPLARSRLYIVGLLAVIFIMLVIATKTYGMGDRERAVFDFVYTMTNSLEWFAKLVTQLGSSWFALGVIGLLFVVKWDPRPALVLARNVVITYASVVFLKFIVSRPRPIILLQDFTARSVVTAGDAFPSGHTALATVASLSIVPYLPRGLRWIPIAWIVVVGWSRIYLGVHAPLDVLGGFILGLCVVLLADYIPWPVYKKH